MTITKELKELVEDLKEKFKISQGEALEAAIQLQRNDILKKAFVVTSDTTNTPPALERISTSIAEIFSALGEIKVELDYLGEKSEIISEKLPKSIDKISNALQNFTNYSGLG